MADDANDAPKARYAAQKKYYLAHKPYYAAASRKYWHSRSPERRAEANQKAKEWRDANPERMVAIRFRRARKLREEVVAAYGGFCACCGENEIEFLTVDHIAGDGADERKNTMKMGTEFYRHLRQRGFPSGYQILCYNCNAAKGRGRECPHATIVRRKLTLVKP